VSGRKDFRPSSVLVTGGAGFIGGNLVRWLFRHEPGLTVVALDALTYAGNLESLADVFTEHGAAGDGRFFFVHGDIRDAALMADLLAGRAREAVTGRTIPAPDTILHLAAESHVDRSILKAHEFVSTNVLGTMTLLDATTRELQERPRDFRFVNVSTDEVYGSLGPDDPPFTERTPITPNSPYSASKAGADCLVRAYVETFHLPCLTTRCSNNYGPYHFPEKMIPLIITRALADQPLPIFGDGLNIRDWIFVDDHAEGIWRVCQKGAIGEVYNLGGNAERRNIDVVHAILDLLGKPYDLIQYVRDRPGHDRRYAMDISYAGKTIGWQPRWTFEKGLKHTVDWYVENEEWWHRVRSEAYRMTMSMYLTAGKTA
jgi:dTDP-glucose 4,6-dehydratase